MNTGKHFFAEGEKQKAVQEVVHLIQQGLRTRGDISMAGVKCGAENAIKWAEEQGAIREEFDGTLLLSDEKPMEFTFEDEPLLDIDEPLPFGDLVQTRLSELYKLGLEGRCILECKLKLDECLSFHQWVITKARLKYRGRAKKGYRVFTGRKELVERARKRFPHRLCEVKSLGGKYDTYLLTIGGKLPEYLESTPEEGPKEF